MRKADLREALRAAARVSGESEFFIIGSQAVHAYCLNPPGEVLLSQECDIYPRNHPERVELIDAKLGRLSRFARENGFFVDVITPELATLPSGWEKRLVPFQVDNITAYCLEAHDLVVSKLAAGRLKDLEMVGALLKRGLAKSTVLRRRIGKLPPNVDKESIGIRLKTILGEIA